MTEENAIRPTKKQAELMSFIKAFIIEHGYSPSYREIMNGLKYNSVATVALHVNSLIARGHLVKRGRSARSLEVVDPVEAPVIQTNQVKTSEEKWLVKKIEYYFSQAESTGGATVEQLEQLRILVAALRVLGLEGAAQSFVSRLKNLEQPTKFDA